MLPVISSFIEFWGIVHGRDSGIIRQVEGQQVAALCLPTHRLTYVGIRSTSTGQLYQVG